MPSRRRSTSGAAVDARGADGTTALHWAVRADSLPIVQQLLHAGAEAGAADRYGITPLYLAAVNANPAVLAALLDAGANIEAAAPTGETTLMTATRTGRIDALELLLERGAPVDARDPEFEQTALMLAVREDHPAAVALLIERGADVDARTRVGATPQFTPPCKGTGCGSEGVGINRGGLPDRGRRAAAQGGMTPLLYAARDGRVEAAKALVEAGANIELADSNGIRPLLMALLNNQLPIAELLLERGADPNADDFWGRSPLFAAVDYRNLDMNNRDQDSPTTNGVDRAPILDMIEQLLARGANVNARTREVPPSRRWLYSLGDVSWVDFTGQTPFLRAALSADTAAMQLLARARRGPELGDARRHHAADGRSRRELGRRPDVHRIQGGAAASRAAVPDARRGRQRNQFDGPHGTSRRREPRIERDHPRARRSRRAARRGGQGGPRRAALGRRRVPRGRGCRTQARDD